VATCPSNLCDGLSGAHTCMWLGVVMEEKQYFDIFLMVWVWLEQALRLVCVSL